LDDFAFYAWDARGHGRSAGPRGAAPDLATLVRDLDAFVRHLGETDGVAVEDIALVAQSVGGVLAATWVHDYAPNVRAMVLAAPAFDIRLYVPFARRALALWHRLRGDFRVDSFVRPTMLTHDAERAASYRSDPLITRAVSARVLLDLYATAERVVADARAIAVPTQVLISRADMVVNQAPQHRFFVNLGSADKQRHVLDGFYHDTLGAAGREEVVARVAHFIRACFARPPSPPSLLDADLSGHTRDEADALASPVPDWTAAALYWHVARGALTVGAVLSRGLALGRETGFDSGSTLDYVYRDRAEGAGPVGRMIDRSYLNSIGWRGIRARKRHLEELIGFALAGLRAEGQPRHILDIAAGHGRYVLEAVGTSGIAVDSILLRDFSRRNVEAGQRLIAEKGLDAVARFERGDAFDAKELSRLEPRPTLAVVSGVYELFADNAPVRTSLAGLARAVPPGGFLVYTGQPWHPQLELELIARTLTSHRDGRPWVMRRRTQAEMDQLVAAAGFRKVEQRIDPWGIFTVSLARRDQG
jgi:alpha-beta hydrolase superfamily lysophospholipase/SAM-dependent methyltransferase